MMVRFKDILLLFGFVLLTSNTVAQGSKNVLLIFLDDLNDWVVRNPETLTPNIDKLASKGVVFNNAHCSSPVCRSSREAIHTGLRPTTTGVTDNLLGFFRNRPGFADWQSIPEYFREHGYETISAGKILHHGRGGGVEPSEDSDPIAWDNQRVGATGTPSPPDSLQHLHGMVGGEVGEGLDGYFESVFDFYPVDASLEETEDWKSADYIASELEKNRTQPFYMACGIYRPHMPWYAPQEYFDLYDTANITLPEVMENDLEDLPPWGLGRVRYGGGVHKEVLRTGSWKKAIIGYQASISYADACVGRVLDALENSPYRDNTIVVLLGDHGFHLGEKQHWAKLALWERSTRTTLIVYDPSQATKGVSETVVSLQDIPPTLIDLAGLPPRTDIQGRNIKEVFLNPSRLYEGYALTTHVERHSLRTTQWRYIRYNETQDELYDHSNDPNEWFNLAEDPGYGTIKAELSQQMDELLGGSEYPLVPVPIHTRWDSPKSFQSEWKTRTYEVNGRSTENRSLKSKGVLFGID